MKTAEEVKPNNAPVYAAALYPGLARIFVDHGYALAVHGSLARDFDLIAVPWAKKVSRPKTVLKAITKKFSIQVLHDGYPFAREWGRVAYQVSIAFGECYLDLSFFPDITHPKRKHETTTGKI